ncbi:hypothetical protein JW935_26530 [candidate division KSB1 bacterium]|nr:hypothetical protein [candidate division KSB1 bacterium]
MKNFIHFTLVVLILIALTSCQNLPFPWWDGSDPEIPPPIQIIPESQVRELPKDLYEIKNVEIVEDTIIFEVRYGGGCEEHDFLLVNYGGFMESWPVQTKVLLSHDNNGDACKALITQEVRFNLIPLKLSYLAMYPGSEGIIILQIIDPNGTNERPVRIRYTF